MLAQMEEKLAGNDMEGTAFYAHKLKSNLRLLGLERAGSIADAIEVGAKTGSDYDFKAGMVEMSTQLDAALKEVAAELASL